MRFRVLILLVLPFTARAAETCEWLSAGTASGVLGSAATVSVTHESANRDDAVCSFASASGSLRIEVHTTETPHNDFTSRAAQCGAEAVAVKAIGNEAVVCNANSGLSARVVGRVRNRVFTIVIGAADSQSALRERARAVAEHVAGNLF
jgi:hypothetical protein